MKNKRRFTFLIFLCLVVLVTGLVGCGTPVPPTTPPPPPPTDTPAPAEIDVDSFALNEIIITGPKEAMDEQVLTDPAALGLELVTEVDLSYLATRNQEPASGEVPKFPTENKIQTKRLFSSNQYSSLVMRLYRNLDEISTLLQKVEELNGAGNAVSVFADPNYLTDPLAGDSCGNPYSGGGSPYSGGGSPYANLGFDMTVDDFRNQWAFKAPSIVAGGVSLPANSVVTDSGAEAASFTGIGSTVAVFDTAPWVFDADPWTGTESISLADGSTFDIPVSDSINKYYTLFSTPASAPTPTSTRVDVRDHGLFVAGLVKTVAPDSDIRLYRVLGDDGCGNLFVLAAAIHEFVNEKSLTTGRLNSTVINLSLGVHIPDQEFYKLRAADSLPPQIAALDTAIIEANKLDAVIIAASGNDSAPPSASSALPAQDMQLPAFYIDVLGVGATNQAGIRSCFSNKSDVAAPGGQGGQSTGEPAKPCAPRTDTALLPPLPCSARNMSMCEYGVIGLSVASPSGYGLWSGTSFSAPLVSGLAALAFEKAGDNRTAVYCLIEHGARKVRPDDSELGWGVIDISESLRRQDCP